MRAYEPVACVPVLRMLARMPRRRAERLIEIIISLPRFAETDARSVGRDAEGRPLRYIVIDRVGITFWVDHAVCQYRIVQLEISRR